MQRGQHPNSIKNLIPHQQKAGEPSKNPSGRPPKQMTDRVEQRLDDVLPDDAEGNMLRAKFKLGKKATWRDAITEKRLRAVLIDDRVYEDFTDRVEGRAPESLQVSGLENRDVTIRVLTVESEEKK